MPAEKLRKAIWFLRRPNHWAHARQLAVRKLLPKRDTAHERARAFAWAAERAVPVADALVRIGLAEAGNVVPLFPVELLREGQLRAKGGPPFAQMGGAGALDLIFAATKLSGARRVVETGVAYGWSSLAILAGLINRDGARLISVDMSYPMKNYERWVGIVVPDRMRHNWKILREPDRRGIEKAIARCNGPIDLCHYDSDKSYWGRGYAYPLLLKALGPQGVFISDDIEDNLRFAEFVDEHKLRFAVTEFEGKYAGIARR